MEYLYPDLMKMFRILDYDNYEQKSLGNLPLLLEGTFLN